MVFLFLFSGCGELDTLFPSNGSYQVKTLVNGASLEDCSIIRSDDKIRPYFVVPVVKDQDLIGLLAYLQDSHGEVVGERIRYILEDYADEPVQTTTETQETPEAERPEAADTADEDPTEEDEESETRERMAGDLPENGAVRERWSYADTKLVEKPDAVEIVIQSLAQDLPYLPLPKNLGIGSYVLVFEALGKREILSRTETNVYYLGSAEFNLKDISVHLPGRSNSQLILPGTTVLLETRLDFDSRLDPYVIWYRGKNIISEGKISDGAGSILWKAPEQAGFHSLRLEAFPVRIRRNLTGLTREITLPVSPKALSLGYFFENDSQYTGRSPLAAGIAYPEQVQLITAMISALEESEDVEDYDDPDSFEEKEPPVMPEPPKLLRWYQFEGSLHDSMSPWSDEQFLIRSDEKAPYWAAAGQTYGLCIEPDTTYSLSPVSFFDNEQDQGGGIFLLYIKPPQEGVIFNVFFPSQSSETDGAWIDIIKERNIITLRLSAGGKTVEIPVYLPSSGAQEFIPVAAEFYIRPYRLEARLSLGEEHFSQDKAGSIKLSGALTGEGRIKLGAQNNNNTARRSSGKVMAGYGLANPVSVLEKSKTENIPTLQTITQEPSAPEPVKSQPEGINTDSAEEMPVSEEQDADTPSAAETFTSETITPNTIWNELAILLSSVPLLEEEVFMEAVAEAVIGEQEAVVSADNTMNNKPADLGPAIPESTTPEPAITGSLTSLQEEIPAPDFPAEDNFAEVDDTVIGETEEVEFPAADTGDSIQEEENEIPPVTEQIIPVHITDT